MSQIAGVLDVQNAANASGKNNRTSRLSEETISYLSDQGSSPATRLASQTQKEKALWACGTIILITALFAPFAGTTWPLIPAFLPAYQTAIILAYSITAYLTFAHYRVTGSSALLHLSGYCFYTGAILIAQFATFPGLFVPNTGLFGGTQSTIWLWFFWHVGTPAGILLSMLILSSRITSIRNLSNQTKIFMLSLVALISASVGAAVLFGDYLPVLDIKGDFSGITTTGVAPCLQAITLAALFVLWRVTRFKTVLQVWLGVALIAMLCDNTITMLGAHRLSVGWYVGRFNGLVSAAVILLVYLAEINRAYFKSVNDAKELTVSYSMLEKKVDRVRIDQLTGLSGRGLFLEQAEALLASGASKQISVAVLFVDLDGFKHINDQFGHDHGDAVLAKTAAILRANLRDGDIAGRIGGDEFVVCIAAPIDSLERTARRVAERIVSKVSEIGGGIGCSIGISLSKAGDPDLSTDLRHADEAMYLAKKRGKNRFVVHGRPELELVAVA